jgi:site-specific DNA-methyltransferase (adenine-specific)
MKRGLFTSGSAEWSTPAAVFEPLHAEFGFMLDVCATRGNAKCRKFFTLADDGLSKPWRGSGVFCNPPYGRQIGLWVRKAWESSQEGATVVCLVPARTDSAWWHDYAMRAEIRFLRGRLYFERPDGSSGRAPFPSAVLVFRPKPCPVNRVFGQACGR